MSGISQFSAALSVWLRGGDVPILVEFVDDVVELRDYFRVVGVCVRTVAGAARGCKSGRELLCEKRMRSCDLGVYDFLQRFPNGDDLYKVWQFVGSSYLREVLFVNDCGRVGVDDAWLDARARDCLMLFG